MVAIGYVAMRFFKRKRMMHLQKQWDDLYSKYLTLITPMSR